MGADRSEDAPPQVIAQALQIFRPPTTAPAPTLVQRLRALVQVEEARMTPAFGIHSATTPEAAPALRLLFRAEAYDVDLHIAADNTPHDATWSVSGQVLGNLQPGGRVVIQGEAQRGETQLNDLSEFVLPALPTGRYQLVITLTEAEIEINELMIGA